MSSAAKTFFFSLSGDTKLFDVVSFEMREWISRPSLLRIHLVSAKPDIDPESMIGKSGTLEIEGGRSPRHFHGAITDFALGNTPDEGDGHETRRYHYGAVLHPRAAYLDLRSDCRIFQKQTAAAIIKAVFKDAGLPPDALTFKTYRDAPERAYCVQYHETDLAFVHRLLAEEGWWYAFDHSGSQEVMEIQDQNMGARAIDEDDASLLYKPMSGGATTEEHATSFLLHRRAALSGYKLRDYDFTHPAFELSVDANSDGDEGLVFHEPHGRYFSAAHGQALAKSRLEATRAGMLRASGDSNVAALGAGTVFTLDGAERDATNGKYLLTSVTHHGSQPQFLEEQAGGGGSSYSNSFTAIPHDLPYRPPQVAKPVVHGPQSAVVVGPEGEEIYVDEHARVKVQFHWDRQGRNDANSSCWVRVAQGWAGTKYGAMFIPRIGQEVIVDFFEGDPDRPVITGRLYHATQRPPYDLPQNKTRSTIRTHTHKGEGFNEIRFEDRAGEEQIFVHGQKDLDIIVRNDRRETVGATRHLTVGGAHYQAIGTSSHRIVGKNDVHKVDADLSLQVGGNRAETVAGAQMTQIGDTYYLKVSGKLVIESGSEVTVRGPGGFVKIDGGGVLVNGTLTQLNNGGSPGDGKSLATVEAEKANPAQNEIK